MTYANDIILFSKATRNDASNIVSCVEKYCNWSGQNINRAKSGVFFSKHSRPNNRKGIKHLLNMKSLKKDAIYLGDPLFLSRAPSMDFKFLLDKLETKLIGWRIKCLSWAGRSTLITSVARAIPNYTMLTFSIPSNICDKLDSATRRFWWKPKGRFIAWRAWEKVCHPKRLGGWASRKQKNSTLHFLLNLLGWLLPRETAYV